MLGPCPGLSLGQRLEGAWLARAPRWCRRWLRRGCGAFGHLGHAVTPGHGQRVGAAGHPWGTGQAIGWASGGQQGHFGGCVCALRVPRYVPGGEQHRGGVVWLRAQPGMRRTCPPTPVQGCVRGACARGRALQVARGRAACERCRVCPRACAGGCAVGNALFSFPLQKTGHSRRFGRFTHGALSYQELAPPPCRGGGGKQRLCGAGHGPQNGAGGSWCPPVSLLVSGHMLGMRAGGRQPAAEAVPGQLGVCWVQAGGAVGPHAESCGRAGDVSRARGLCLAACGGSGGGVEETPTLRSWAGTWRWL